MKEKIYTILINETIEEGKGCPLCLIRDKFEGQAVSYYTGAAMMEPDVRIETNAKGFCARHIDMMLEQGNKLSVALMLHTHEKQIKDQIKKMTPLGKFRKNRPKEQSCALCDRINMQMKQCTENFAYMLDDEEFKQKLAKHQNICVKHFFDLSALIKGKEFDFLKENILTKLSENEGNLFDFTKSFDYKAEQPDKEKTQSVETAAQLLCFGKQGYLK